MRPPAAVPEILQLRQESASVKKPAGKACVKLRLSELVDWLAEVWKIDVKIDDGEAP